MGTLSGSAISTTYKKLIFTGATSGNAGDLFYTLDSDGTTDTALTTFTSALTFSAMSTFSSGLAIGSGQFVKDHSGNELIGFSATADAINYLSVTNSAASNTVSLTTAGGDDNVDLTLTPKGTGGVISTPLFTATAGVKLANNIIYNSEGTAALTLDADEDLTITGDLQVSGGVIQGTTDGDLSIKSDGHMDFRIDSDNDESTQLYRFYSGTGVSTIAELDESGHLQIDGDLTLGGNDIKASDGTTAITTSGANVTLAGTLAAGGHVTFAADTDLIWDTQFDIKNTTDGYSYLRFNESGTSITVPATVVLDNDGGHTMSPIIQTAATKTLDKFDSGRIIAVDTTSNDVAVTLPAAEAGLNFKFMITKKGGSNDLEIISPSETNYFYGGVAHLDTDAGSGGDEVVSVVSDYNSNDYLTLLLADVGTVVELVCNGTLWYVSGTVNSNTAPVFNDTSGL